MDVMQRIRDEDGGRRRKETLSRHLCCISELHRYRKCLCFSGESRRMGLKCCYHFRSSGVTAGRERAGLLPLSDVISTIWTKVHFIHECICAPLPLKRDPGSAAGGKKVFYYRVRGVQGTEFSSSASADWSLSSAGETNVARGISCI